MARIRKKEPAATPPKLDPVRPVQTSAVAGTTGHAGTPEDPRTPSLVRFSAQVDATVAASVIYGLESSTKGLARFIGQRQSDDRATRSRLGARLEAIAGGLSQAASEGVQQQLDEVHRRLYDRQIEALRSLALQLTSSAFPVALSKEAKAALAQIEATLTAAGPPPPPEEGPVVLLDVAAKSAAALFDAELPGGPCRVYVDQPVPAPTLDLLAERAASGLDLHIVDVGTGLTRRVFGQEGRAYTDDPGWAASSSSLTLEAPAPTALAPALEPLMAAGVAGVRFQLTEPLSGPRLMELAALVQRGLKLSLEIADDAGRTLFRIDRGGEVFANLSGRPAGPLRDAYRSFTRACLYAPNVTALRIAYQGELARTAEGWSYRRAPADLAASQEVLIEQLAHGAGRALGVADPEDPTARSLRAFFTDALHHVLRSTDGVFDGLRTPGAWSAALDAIATLAPSTRKLMIEALQTIASYSEHPQSPGFGLPTFQHTARGANAAALARLLTEGEAPQIAAALAEIRGMLGPQSPKVTTYGAVVEMLADKELGEGHRRSSSADEQSAWLRLIDEAIKDSAGAERSYRICNLPRDPTLGQARTPTPDFAVEQITGNNVRAIYLDAKSIDAKFFSASHVENVRSAVHQSLSHNFQIPASTREGWPFIRLYRAELTPEAKERYFALVQQGLTAGHGEAARAAVLRARPPPPLAIVVLDSHGREEVYRVPMVGRPERVAGPLFGQGGS